MKIFAAVAIVQLLLVVNGDDVPGERKRVGCYYLGVISERYGALNPEDIDVSICTHLEYLHGAINNETEEIILRPIRPDIKTGGEGYIARLVKLKERNPDLKLVLHVVHMQLDTISRDPSRRSNFIQNGIKWLNGSGFDGLDLIVPTGPERSDNQDDLICEMKNEFDKYGFSVSTSFTGSSELPMVTMRNISRCSDQVTLITHIVEWATHRMAPMNIIKPDVKWLILRGVPANKISISVPAFGAIFTLEDPEVNGLGAPVSGPGEENRELMDGLGIPNKELIRKMNDSTLGWTIRRDNQTKEPYAFTRTGLWTSYEDAESTKYKTSYVMDEGLGGINMVAIDYEDPEGIGGQGKFPLTRIVHSKLIGDLSAATDN